MEHLGNQCPITLLNVSYKIFANALQLRLQPLLMEMKYKPNQFPHALICLIYNVLLVQETIDQGKCTNQELVFFKLDFAKAYDKVSWGFSFEAMLKMAMALEFIVEMRELIFKDAR